MQIDSILGKQIHEHLISLNLETPANFKTVDKGDQEDVISESVERIMIALGLNLTDDSLVGTPRRVAKMYIEEVFCGLDYSNFPKCTVIENKIKADEVVCVKDIKLHSACEHHLVPIIGVAHVAYIPNTKIVGLSKLNRVVDFFSRRPQVQERLTEQLAAALSFMLESEDVAVIIEAEHLCVKWRGVQDPTSKTITSKLKGRFRENSDLRNELLTLIKD